LLHRSFAAVQGLGVIKRVLADRLAARTIRVKRRNALSRCNGLLFTLHLN
jgi:hypothetical protein